MEMTIPRATLFGDQPEHIYAVGYRYTEEYSPGRCGGRLGVLYIEADSPEQAKEKAERETPPPGHPMIQGVIEVFAVMPLHVNDFLYWK